MKKFISVLLILVLSLSFLTACGYVPPQVPDIPGISEQSGESANLAVQNFSNAWEAFEFGQDYFNNQAEYYETTATGVLAIQGNNTCVLTKRYKSKQTGNFLYETNTLGNLIGILNLDPTLAFKAYKSDDSDTVYYSRVNGSYSLDNPNGSKENASYSAGSYKGATASFTNVQPQTKSNWQQYQQSVTGTNPQNLTAYNITTQTIRQESFEKDKDGFAYVFKFSLNEQAVLDYKKQIEYFSGRNYNQFNPMGLADGLSIEFMSDKYGRILQLNIFENYSITALGINSMVVTNITEYFAYNKHPKIEIYSNGLFNGPSVNYADLTDDVKKYKISFDSQGGNSQSDMEAEYNCAVGELPVPQYENYEFAGWFTKKNGEGIQYTADSVLNQKSPMILYAFWTHKDSSTQWVYAPVNDGRNWEIVKGLTSDADFTVPEQYNAKPIVSIAADAFKDNKNIVSLTIPNSITKIKANAFNGCTSITSLSLSANLDYIGDSAFRYCDKLKIINIPASVSHVDNFAFSGCTALIEVSFASGSKLTVIGNNAFGGEEQSGGYFYCPSGLKNLNLENCTKLEIIGNYAFYGAMALDAVNIPASVTKISNYAFGLCSGLLDVNFASQSKLTSIGDFAFAGYFFPESNDSVYDLDKLGSVNLENCPNLEIIGENAFAKCAIKDIIIPASVTSIGKNAFRECKQLETVVFQNDSKLLTLGNEVFYGNSKLESVNLQICSKLEKIGNQAFNSCTFLDNIVIPVSVKTIGVFAFGRCPNLFNFTLYDNPNMVLDEGVVYTSDFKTILFALPRLLPLSMSLNDKVTLIMEYAFYDCTLLNLQSLPSGVKEIREYTFYNCTSLEIHDLSNITIIDEGAFENCSALTNITLVKIEQINDAAFSGCTSLTTLTLNTSIDAGKDVPALGISVFDGALNAIYVPASSVAAYKTAANWINYAAIIQPVS